jgi:hypothetical protein
MQRQLQCRKIKLSEFAAFSCPVRIRSQTSTVTRPAKSSFLPSRLGFDGQASFILRVFELPARRRVAARRLV